MVVRRSGMTLIEVLMAVFILATVSIGLLQALSQCASAFTIARRTQELQNVLSLAEAVHPLIVDQDPVEDLAVSGDTSIADGYTFSRECAEEEDDDEDHLYVVTSTVQRDGGGWGSTLTVVNYVYFEE